MPLAVEFYTQMQLKQDKYIKSSAVIELTMFFCWLLFDGQTFCIFSGKLLGMNETSATIAMATANASSQDISKQVLSVANVGVVPSSQNNFHR